MPEQVPLPLRRIEFTPLHGQVATFLDRARKKEWNPTLSDLHDNLIQTFHEDYENRVRDLAKQKQIKMGANDYIRTARKIFQNRSAWSRRGNKNAADFAERNGISAYELRQIADGFRWYGNFPLSRMRRDYAYFAARRQLLHEILDPLVKAKAVSISRSSQVKVLDPEKLNAFIKFHWMDEKKQAIH